MGKVNPSFHLLARDPVALVGFGFGSGLSPVMPGTAGTLAAIPLYWLIAPLPLYWYLLILIVSFVVGIYICGATAKKLGVHDHGGIVWDEFVGLWITLIAAPPGWLWILLGFILFRFFDMVKPWPIKRIDRAVKGGLGIMLDDVFAGVAAAIVLQLAAYFVMPV